MGVVVLPTLLRMATTSSTKISSTQRARTTTTTDTVAGTKASVSELTDQMAMPNSSPSAFPSAEPAAWPLILKICTLQILLESQTRPTLPVQTEVSAISSHTQKPLAALISPTKQSSTASKEHKELQLLATWPTLQKLMTVTSVQNSSHQHLQCTRCQLIFRPFLRISSSLTSSDQTQTQLDHATLESVLLLLSFLSQWPNFFVFCKLPINLNKKYWNRKKKKKKKKICEKKKKKKKKKKK